MSCLTSVIEPLRAANEISGTTTFKWELISERLEPVPSSAGIPFEPKETLAKCTPPDYLLLLSAPSVQFTDASTSAHLRRLERHGCTLGAISGGVFPLMRSGVTKSERLSVHWCYEAAFASEFPEAQASDKVIEISSKCVSASGAAAAFDLALVFIDDALGANIATEVACWFQHPMMRKLGVKQSVPVHQTPQIEESLPPIVARALEIFTEDLSEPKSIATIAETLGISSRHLERSFKQALGRNPTSYFRWVRMQAGRQIVLYTNDSVADTAAAVGYTSSRHFIRQYRDEYGISPQEDRQRINLFRVKGNLPLPSV